MVLNEKLPTLESVKNRGRRVSKNSGVNRNEAMGETIAAEQIEDNKESDSRIAALAAKRVRHAAKILDKDLSGKRLEKEDRQFLSTLSGRIALKKAMTNRGVNVDMAVEMVKDSYDASKDTSLKRELRFKNRRFVAQQITDWEGLNATEKDRKIPDTKIEIYGDAQFILPGQHENIHQIQAASTSGIAPCTEIDGEISDRGVWDSEREECVRDSGGLDDASDLGSTDGEEA